MPYANPCDKHSLLSAIYLGYRLDAVLDKEQLPTFRK